MGDGKMAIQDRKTTRLEFGLLAVGFTGMSAYNCYGFYKALFGMSMALLIVSAFETSRISCLFRFANRGRRNEFVPIIIYVIVASAIGFGSTNSYYSKILRENFRAEKVLRDQIHEIKKAYSEGIEERIAEVNRDITYLKNLLAKKPGSDYLKRRIGQYIEKRDSIDESRDEFLNQDPEGREKWIKANSALLGIEINRQSAESEEMRSVKLALKEMWGLKKITTQKMVGIILLRMIAK